MLQTPGSTTSNRIQNYRTLAYVIGTLVYLVVGAAIFDRLESAHEAKSHADLTAQIVSFRQRHNISERDFRNLTYTVRLRQQASKKQWKFIGSFYYATVVLALIGYGHAIPNTTAGRAVTIAYALIGIPMWLIMIQSVGERLNALISFVLKHIKRKFQRRKEPHISVMELLTCEALLAILTLATGSYVFHECENWLYFDAFYYCVFTLATIGFGDFVPMQRSDYGNIDWLYALFCIMFILTGLTIVASSGNLLILHFVETNSKRSRHERLEMEERRRQQVRVVGDVISSNGRFITLDDEDDARAMLSPVGAARLPAGHSPSNLSLCSCRGHSTFSFCIPVLCKRKFKRKQQQSSAVHSFRQSFSRSPLMARRTLRQEVLDTLQSRNELDGSVVFRRSHLQLDKTQPRNSI